MLKKLLSKMMKVIENTKTYKIDIPLDHWSTIRLLDLWIVRSLVHYWPTGPMDHKISGQL